jgi:hypothetical protein
VADHLGCASDSPEFEQVWPQYLRTADATKAVDPLSLLLLPFTSMQTGSIALASKSKRLGIIVNTNAISLFYGMPRCFCDDAMLKAFVLPGHCNPFGSTLPRRFIIIM